MFICLHFWKLLRVKHVSMPNFPMYFIYQDRKKCPLLALQLALPRMEDLKKRPLLTVQLVPRWVESVRTFVWLLVYC